MNSDSQKVPLLDYVDCLVTPTGLSEVKETQPSYINTGKDKKCSYHMNSIIKDDINDTVSELPVPFLKPVPKKPAKKTRYLETSMSSDKNEGKINSISPK